MSAGRALIRGKSVNTYSRCSWKNVWYVGGSRHSARQRDIAGKLQGLTFIPKITIPLDSLDDPFHHPTGLPDSCTSPGIVPHHPGDPPDEFALRRRVDWFFRIPRFFRLGEWVDGRREHCGWRVFRRIGALGRGGRGRGRGRCARSGSRSKRSEGRAEKVQRCTPADGRHGF